MATGWGVMSLEKARFSSNRLYPVYRHEGRMAEGKRMRRLQDQKKTGRSLCRTYNFQALPPLNHVLSCK
jgi:hypothetical protein